MKKKYICPKAIALLCSMLLCVSVANAGFYSYEKVTDQYTTYSLTCPDYEQTAVTARIVELATIKGATYIYVPDGVSLPAQHAQVAKTLKEITPDAALITQIRKESLHYQLIEKRISSVLPGMAPNDGRYFMWTFDSAKMETEKSKYELNEAKNLKESMLSHIAATVGYADEVVQWGSEQKNKLGLGESVVQETK